MNVCVEHEFIAYCSISQKIQQTNTQLYVHTQMWWSDEVDPNGQVAQLVEHLTGDSGDPCLNPALVHCIFSAKNQHWSHSDGGGGRYL